MSIPRFTFPATFRTSLLAWLLSATISLSAAEGGFSATLSTDQKTSAGLISLTPAEITALDHLVAADIARARKATDFEASRPFVARHSEQELKPTGLDRLTPEQLKNLDALIANSIVVSPKPKARPRIKDSEVFSTRLKPEVHGGFSLTYGQGSGGSSFRSASMWVDYFDPNSGLGLSFGLTQSRGKGFFGYTPGYYDDYPFYGAGFGYFGAPFRSFGNNNWYDAEDRSIGASLEWNRNQYRDFRRR